MSSSLTASGAVAFFDLYSLGRALADEIDDYVDQWHERADDRAKSLPLHEYLGLTLDEYDLWVREPDLLPQILIARREARPISEVMSDYLDELPMAARTANTATVKALRAWLMKRQTH